MTLPGRLTLSGRSNRSSNDLSSLIRSLEGSPGDNRTADPRSLLPREIANPHLKIVVPLFAVSLLMSVAASLTRAAPASDKKLTPSAEDVTVNNAANWNLFISGGSEAAKITKKQSEVVSPSGRSVIEISSDRFARFGIMPSSGWMTVQPGETFRLTAWVKSDGPPTSDFRNKGVLLRATLRTAGNEDYPDGHFYVGAQGVVLGAPAKYKGVGGNTTDWTKLEGEIVIPPTVTRVMFFVFGWGTTGTIYVSDAQMSRAEAGTTHQPLLGDEPPFPLLHLPAPKAPTGTGSGR
jgi:hypothetical protein